MPSTRTTPTPATTSAPIGATTLPTAIRANALLSTTTGLLALLGAPWLDDVLGAPAVVLVALGIGLLGFAAGLRHLLTRPARLREDARVVVVLDLLWVAGAVPVVAADLLTPVGDVVTALVTLLVAAVTVGQVRGIRRE